MKRGYLKLPADQPSSLGLELTVGPGRLLPPAACCGLRVKRPPTSQARVFEHFIPSWFGEVVEPLGTFILAGGSGRLSGKP